MFVRYS